MRRRGHRLALRHEGGQSLIETAIFLPILILLVAYAVDFGYFFIVAANLTSASRNAAEYSIQGHSSPAQSTLPIAGPITTNTSVAALAVGDLSNLAASATTTSVEVCSKILGTTSNVTNCSSYGPAGTVFYAGDRSGGANFLPESRRRYLHGAAADSDELFFSFTGALTEVPSAGFDAGDGLDEASRSISAMVSECGASARGCEPRGKKFPARCFASVASAIWNRPGTL